VAWPLRIPSRCRRRRSEQSADVGLISFAEKEPTLEDVFMMVTKGLVT